MYLKTNSSHLQKLTLRIYDNDEGRKSEEPVEAKTLIEKERLLEAEKGVRIK